MTLVERYRSYEFLVMPFGLTNIPTTFYNLMNNVFYDFINKFIVVYLDDIVVYSESMKEYWGYLYWGYLKRVLDRLREHWLSLKNEKCEFCMENQVPKASTWQRWGENRWVQGSDNSELAGADQGDRVEGIPRASQLLLEVHPKL